jgi:hypothetical protein
MFNEDSAMREEYQGGTEIQELQNPIVSVRQQTNTEEPQPSATAGPTNLAWWDDMKYFWKRNSRNNGFHLAPQDSYVDDVLVEGDFEIQLAANHFMEKNSGDLKAAKAEAKAANEIIQVRTGFDTSGVETNDVYRFYRNRAIIARKIVGSSAVSANHRLMHAEASGNNPDDVKKTTYFQSDLENCKRWAFKACYYEYIISQLPDHEIIRDLPTILATGVGRQLYDDAVEKGNKLKAPAPAKKSEARKHTAEELRLMRA